MASTPAIPSDTAPNPIVPFQPGSPADQLDQPAGPQDNTQSSPSYPSLYGESAHVKLATNSHAPPKPAQVDCDDAYHKLNPEQQKEFWETYNNRADAYHGILIEILCTDLDTLLVFVSSASSLMCLSKCVNEVF